MDLTRISIDGGTQTRAALNEAVVTEYADALRDGVKLPAVVVFFDGSAHWLADGFHRYFAHKAARKASINAEVREGSKRDAVLFSVGANSTHGLRRSNEDKRRSVKTMLDDKEWSTWSDRDIAKQCGVSQPFVSALRKPAEVEKVITVITPTPVDNSKEKEPSAVEFPSEASEKPGPADEPDFEQNEEENAIVILSQENDELRARLAVGLMDATEEEKQEAADTIADLRQQLKTLTAENAALRSSRDHYQSEASQLRKQIKMNEKELKRARATA
ncbi:hypothetical protein [Variovorax sp. PAMC 28711]|uniref:hypothetical protein n=1 Tax=Variovorax sp. PAMC 28711 TaxID=1795631 RepID=UPI000B32347C|nr:hypothetical protein [Variovorax sp. PAMC 28711]